MWRVAQTEIIYRFYVHAWFGGSHRSVGYGKQCSLVWYVLRREDGHVIRALDFEVEGQRKKRRSK